MAATQDNMTCAVCTEVYRSPRFLPCHHTFCLPCLEELAKRHVNTIPCPTCRARATVPPGGVCDLQVNLCFTEEALEQARSEKRQSMCRVHTKECVIFYCSQCDQAICIRCKLTKHDGHVTEDMPETVSRCKKTIEKNIKSFKDAITRLKSKLDSCKQSEKRALEKRAAVTEQIHVQYDVIVAMAAKYRDQALMELKKTSDDLEKDLAADTQRVQGELNSLLKLQSRAQRAFSWACDTEVLQVEREMTRGEGNSEQLREREDGLPVTTYRPVLHGDFHNYIEDHYMKTFIGSPVKQIFPSKKTADIVRVGRFGDGGCREVHALRQREDGRIDVFYGGTGGDYTKEKGVNVNSDGSRGRERDLGIRISCVTRKHDILKWEEPSFCHLGSKNKSMHLLIQDFETGEFSICAIKDEQTDEKEIITLILSPQLHRAHNFDSNEQGTFFAVVDEDENNNSDDESMKTNNSKADSRRSHVVRLYSNKSDDPIATYTSPIQPFFPSDVCFYGKDVLLIADWMNDCVHVTRVSERGIEFVCFLPGSGDLVRPTALNLDLNGQLLIGCGDGWILRVPVDY